MKILRGSGGMKKVMKADVLFLIVNILFCFAAMHLFDLAEGHIHTVYCRLAITPDLPQSYHVCFPFVKWAYVIMMFAAASYLRYFKKCKFLFCVFVEWQLFLALFVIFMIFLLDRLSVWWCM